MQIGPGGVIVSALLAGEVHLTAEAAATGIAAAARGARTVIIGTNGSALYLSVEQ